MEKLDQFMVLALFLMFIKELNKEAKFIIPKGNQEESAFVSKKMF